MFTRIVKSCMEPPQYIFNKCEHNFCQLIYETTSHLKSIVSNLLLSVIRDWFTEEVENISNRSLFQEAYQFKGLFFQSQ